MAQNLKIPILSLCIPIYNRLSYLERQLVRMMEDKDLFDEQIQLIISDNCSTEDLKSCCETFQKKGLKFEYHRNDTNLGADGNFDWCFHHASGKYVWLLGSDDVPVSGMLRKIMNYISQGEYGLVHLSMHNMDRELAVFKNTDDMIVAVNYWITFLSANIIRTETIKTIDLSKFIDSNMIQVPAYLNACCSFPENVIIYKSKFFESDTDNANNGGYNIYDIFINNLFGIYEGFVTMPTSGEIQSVASDKISHSRVC